MVKKDGFRWRKVRGHTDLFDHYLMGGGQVDTLRMELVEDGAVRAIVQVPRTSPDTAVSFHGPVRAIVQVPR